MVSLLPLFWLVKDLEFISGSSHTEFLFHIFFQAGGLATNFETQRLD